MMRILPICFTLGCLILSPVLPNREYSGSEIIEQLRHLHDNFPQEKVYIQHDKAAYTLDDDLWFKIYLLDARYHIPSYISEQAYVELVSPANEVVARRAIRIERGEGYGDFRLNKNWAPGNYILRGYSQYMRNYDEGFFFRKQIAVMDSYRLAGEFDGDDVREVSTRSQGQAVREIYIQFFPEGGDLVAGLGTKIAFKAVDQQGKGIDVSGEVFDDEGQTRAALVTQKMGFGFFRITPEKGRQYYADVRYDGRVSTFRLPVVEPTGYVMNVSTRDEESLLVSTKSNHPSGLEGAFVIAHIRGQILGSFEIDESTAQIFRIPIRGFPRGILHLTLFSPAGIPVSERLVFVHKSPNIPTVRVNSNEITVGHREKVIIDVDLRDAEGEELSASASLTVNDRLLTPFNSENTNVVSYLLLESDIRGRIENPGYYFEEQDPERRFVLDLLLLTQGWRRFNWDQVLFWTEPELTYPNENGFMIQGRITKLTNPYDPVEADVFLSIFGEEFVTHKITTDVDGRFMFPGIKLYDSTYLVVQANEENERRDRRRARKKRKAEKYGPVGKREVDIHLTDYGFPEINRGLATLPTGQDAETMRRHLEATRRKNTLDSMYRALWTIDLEGVSVTAAMPGLFDRPTMIYSEYDSRIVVDSISSFDLHTNIFTFLRGKVPGLEVRGSEGFYTFFIRGSSSIALGAQATVLVDGVPVSNLTANNVQIRNVAFIDVLKGLNSTAVYGTLGRNGIVAVYTRGLDVQSPIYVNYNGILTTTHPGYYKTRQFYSPNYDLKPPDQEKPDHRLTLHWDPNVRITKGEAQVEFYSGDRSSMYEVILEGISEDGEPFRGVTTFRTGDQN